MSSNLCENCHQCITCVPHPIDLVNGQNRVGCPFKTKDLDPEIAEIVSKNFNKLLWKD